MCFVYWLYDEKCVSPDTDGYVGVSSNVLDRLKVHKQKRGETFSFSILFEGSREECFHLEEKLRPLPGMGWNVAVGGARGYMHGHSEETKRKIREANKGKGEGETIISCSS